MEAPPGNSDDEVARTLLIELLAHQFCFPVQWIDTQDYILGSQRTQRLIELGPANALINMAKRTIGLKYESRDMVEGMSRQLFTFQHNLDAISYGERNEVEIEIEAPPEGPPKTVKRDPEPTQMAAPTLSLPTASHSSVVLEDSPPKPVEVLLTIISSSLKRPLSSSEMAQSIKVVCAGRSTLQNEILGDLHAEFGSLPDGAEDLSVQELCDLLQSKWSGKLGKRSLSLLDRMAAQKLPASFHIPVVRKYLKQTWGLGTGRQDSILLEAVQTRLDDRLKDDGIKPFLDGLVKTYMSRNSLKLPETSNTPATNSASAMISAEALDMIEGRQKTSWEEQAALYTNLLGLNVHESKDTIHRLQQRIMDLESQLDGWTAEHGEVYASGIGPIFSSRKTRVFDSWWNWAVQDLLLLVTLADTDDDHTNEDERARICQSIVNRTNDRLLKVIRYLTKASKDLRVVEILRNLLSRCEAHLNSPPLVYNMSKSWAPQTSVRSTGDVVYTEIPRLADAESLRKRDRAVRLGRNRVEGRIYPEEGSSVLRKVLSESRSNGLSLADQNVLVTGAGPGSIGWEIVAQLLSAGAHVIVTSSSYSPAISRHYQDMYVTHGGKGSRLILVPFNQASIRDVEALVKYIYADDGLAMDLDAVIPFAAISENGRTLADFDSKSELAHRLMLTNTIRLLGQIKREKHARRIQTRPAQVILPLSPNHGNLGGDGLYAESKLGLESLVKKFHSEDWADYLLICGAVIGWTRGTNLTADLNIVAQGMEQLGMRTFSSQEMAFHILALLSSAIVELCTDEPLIADLTGGMADLPDIQAAIARIRAEVLQLSQERRAASEESNLSKSAAEMHTNADQHIDIDLTFPRLPQWEAEVQPLAEQLEGMVDLDRVVVVTGFAEVGPWASARVRWDMEVNGQLSDASCIELAWAMGLIRAHVGMLDGEPYAGWMERESNEPIADTAIREKYESYILEHAGVRFMELERGSPSWSARESLHEIEVTRDHEPFEVSREAASQLKDAHGDKIQLTPSLQDERVKVVLTKGAKIMIPKLIATPHVVGGQIPTGWDARTYGIPEDVVNQLDSVTLYALVASAEALHSAGVHDAFELYEHLHPSDVANCVGSGVGGVRSLRQIFKGRYQDANVAQDVLSEAFISSGSAWINMLLLSAAGANRTPVGACATALESLDTACDLIQGGRAKVCLVGAFDDMIKEMSDEFANLQATVNVDEEVAAGREPRDMSRPATSTRAGFVEAEGAGIQVVTSASTALKLGLPIRGVIALTHTAMDKASRSIPAPGRGLLSAAGQTSTVTDSPWMDMTFRRRALQSRLAQIEEMRELQLGYVDVDVDVNEKSELGLDVTRQGSGRAEMRAQRRAEVDRDAERDRREARHRYGNHFWTHDERISPIRGALAVWGLTVDDLDVVSFHGTSTQANEKNEASLVDAHLRHLGRAEGNVLPVVLQKALTGHPKGPAGAWMLNGCLQMMHDGRIPGNFNGDNIDSVLEQYRHVVFPNKTISRPNMKAFAMQLFGFGQKGGMALGVHPRYLFATLQKADYEKYAHKVRQRERTAARQFQKAVFTNTVFRAKDAPPYGVGEETGALLNPCYRANRT